jgi:hypothetical protein
MTSGEMLTKQAMRMKLSYARKLLLKAATVGIEALVLGNKFCGDSQVVKALCYNPEGCGFETR